MSGDVLGYHYCMINQTIHELSVTLGKQNIINDKLVSYTVGFRPQLSACMVALYSLVATSSFDEYLNVYCPIRQLV